MSPLSDDLRRRDADEELSRQWHRMAGVGMEFAAAIIVMGAIGWFLDWLFGLSPWGLVAGMALGFVVGLWQLIRVGMRSLRQEQSRSDSLKQDRQ